MQFKEMLFQGISTCLASIIEENAEEAEITFTLPGHGDFKLIIKKDKE
jgi:hypothetical protein